MNKAKEIPKTQNELIAEFIEKYIGSGKPLLEKKAVCDTEDFKIDLFRILQEVRRSERSKIKFIAKSYQSNGLDIIHGIESYIKMNTPQTIAITVKGETTEVESICLSMGANIKQSNQEESNE